MSPVNPVAKLITIPLATTRKRFYPLTLFFLYFTIRVTQTLLSKMAASMGSCVLRRAVSFQKHFFTIRRHVALTSASVRREVRSDDAGIGKTFVL